MDLSKKIIMALCACAAVGAFSCTIEDRDVEQKNVFLCRSNADCLSGSVCSENDTGKVGRCWRDTEIGHCHDNDGDGYYAATKGYESECNFDADKNPMDTDDSNPLINPNATEVCDGVDNTSDGCVDGLCIADTIYVDGEDDKGLKATCSGKCVPLAQACYGRKNNLIYEEDSACNIQKTGVYYCDKGTPVFATASNCKEESYTKGGNPIPGRTAVVCSYSPSPSETCKDIGYVAIEDNKFKTNAGVDVCTDNIDNDCNGQKDDKDCSETCHPTDDPCYAISEEGGEEANYMVVDDASMLNYINCAIKDYEHCGCIGKRSACEEGSSTPVCQKDGITIEGYSGFTQARNSSSSSDVQWNCLFIPTGQSQPEQQEPEQQEPGEQPEQPGEQPEQPGEQPEQPGEQPEQPGEQPEQPGEQPEQ